MRHRILLLLALWGPVGFASAQTTELPPVPFIIGGDEVISPAESVVGGPLMLPDEPVVPAMEREEVVDATPGQAVHDTAPTTTFEDLDLALGGALPIDDLAAPVAEAPKAEKAAVSVPAKIEAPVAAVPAPVVEAHAATISEGLLPELPVADASPATKVDHMDLLDGLTSEAMTTHKAALGTMVAPDAPVAATTEAAVAPKVEVAATTPSASEDISLDTINDLNELAAKTSETVATPAAAKSPEIIVGPYVPAVVPAQAAQAPEKVAAAPHNDIDMLFSLPPESDVTAATTEPLPVGADPKGETAEVSEKELLTPKTIADAWGDPYELNLPPKRVAGVDGSEHVEGLEYVVGRSNPILPPVGAMAPTVATVGEEFPALNVEKIPLPDLLTYLGNFTPKKILYGITEPFYVTVDLKAKSVEEVIEYLHMHYAIDTEITNDTITIQPPMMIARMERPQPTTPVRALTAEDVAPAPTAPLQPINISLRPSFQSNTVPTASMASLAPSRVGIESVGTSLLPPPDEGTIRLAAARPISVPVTSVVATTAAPASNEVESNWEQVRLKAKMYDLAKQRDELLAERETIERTARDYKIRKRMD